MKCAYCHEPTTETVTVEVSGRDWEVCWYCIGEVRERYLA